MGIQVVGVAADIKHDLQVEEPGEAVYIPYPQSPLELLGTLSFAPRLIQRPSFQTCGSEFCHSTRICRSFALKPRQQRSYPGDERFDGHAAWLFRGTGARSGVRWALRNDVVPREPEDEGTRHSDGTRSRRAQDVAMVLREALWLAGAGAAIGIPQSMRAARLVASPLFGVKTTDAGSQCQARCC